MDCCANCWPLRKLEFCDWQKEIKSRFPRCEGSAKKDEENPFLSHQEYYGVDAFDAVGQVNYDRATMPCWRQTEHKDTFDEKEHFHMLYNERYHVSQEDLVLENVKREKHPIKEVIVYVIYVTEITTGVWCF